MSLPERERLALSAIEERLRRDDPQFAAVMAALSAALPPRSWADRPPLRSRWKGVVALLATLVTACALAVTAPHGSAACTGRRASTPTATVRDPEQVPVASRQEVYEAEHARGC